MLGCFSRTRLGVWPAVILSRHLLLIAGGLSRGFSFAKSKISVPASAVDVPYAPPSFTTVAVVDVVQRLIDHCCAHRITSHRFPSTFSMKKEISHYVVTAHPPGGVLLTAKCNFLSPNSLVCFNVSHRVRILSYLWVTLIHNILLALFSLLLLFNSKL